MTGAALPDSIGTEFNLGADSEVLEMCSGTGEVCRCRHCGHERVIQPVAGQPAGSGR